MQQNLLWRVLTVSAALSMSGCSLVQFGVPDNGALGQPSGDTTQNTQPTTPQPTEPDPDPTTTGGTGGPVVTDTDTDTYQTFVGTGAPAFCNDNFQAAPANCPFTTLTCGDTVNFVLGQGTSFYDDAFWNEIMIGIDGQHLDDGEAVFYITPPNNVSSMVIEVESCEPRYSRVIRGAACDPSNTFRIGDAFELDSDYLESIALTVDNTDDFEVVVESDGNGPANAQLRVRCY